MAEKIEGTINYFDPVDGLEKELLFRFSSTVPLSQSEIDTLFFDAAYYALDETILAGLNITDVGTLIDTDSINYFVGEIP